MVSHADSVESFLRSELTIAGGQPNAATKGFGSARGVDEAVGLVSSLLFKKRYRVRVGPDRKRAVLEKVRRAIAERRQLGFVIPFGGYKHFWNPSAPVVDWAEVFHIEFMIEMLAPLIPLLPGGIRLEYVSEDFIVPEMDNYAPETLDAYAASFSRLLGLYENLAPPGLEVAFWRLSDRYDTAAIEADIMHALPERLEGFRELATGDQERELTRSRRSVHWAGWQDLSHLDAAERHDRIVRARVIEMTFSDLGFLAQHVGAYYEEDLRSCIVFSWGRSRDNATKQFLTMHSSRGSIVDYWIGRGVLWRDRAGFRPTIVSRAQFEAGQWDGVCVDLIPTSGGLHNLEVLDVMTPGPDLSALPHRGS